jgi:DNA-binding SARP family transcriptional activator
MDAYEEDYHRHLLSAQIALGNRREALEDFHRYEEVMIRELDLLPSAKMQELAEKANSLGKT